MALFKKKLMGPERIELPPQPCEGCVLATRPWALKVRVNMFVYKSFSLELFYFH